MQHAWTTSTSFHIHGIPQNTFNAMTSIACWSANAWQALHSASTWRHAKNFKKSFQIQFTRTLFFVLYDTFPISFSIHLNIRFQEYFLDKLKLEKKFMQWIKVFFLCEIKSIKTAKTFQMLFQIQNLKCDNNDSEINFRLNSFPFFLCWAIVS